MTYIEFLLNQARAVRYQSPEAYIIASGDSLDGGGGLELIWAVAHADSMADLITLTGLGPAAFSRAYGLALRTVQDWKAGLRTPPESVRNLLGYAVFSTLAAEN